MKPLFVIYFLLLTFSNLHSQDTVDQNKSDSISRLIDLTSQFPAIEEFDTIPCYDCQFMFIIIQTEYFLDKANERLIKVTQKKRYFPEIKSYHTQLTDSTAIGSYYFTNEQLLKVILTIQTKAGNNKTITFYFSENDINEWKRKGKRGPSIDERESLIWTSEYLLQQAENSLTTKERD